MSEKYCNGCKHYKEITYTHGFCELLNDMIDACEIACNPHELELLENQDKIHEKFLEN